MTDRELMQQALEALEANLGNWAAKTKATIALREALAQPEQELVALESIYETIIQWDEGGGKRSRRELARRIVALYTRPQPAAQWVGLTDEEVAYIADSEWEEAFVRLVEAKLKEKNT